MRTIVASVCTLILLVALPAALAQDTMDEPESIEASTTLRIKLASVLVNDQAKAEKFYSEILGFVKKHDIPVGEFRWLTVVSPDEPEGTQLLLEPNDNPAANTFQKAMFDQSIPAASFNVEDVQRTYEKLQGLGVAFTMPPTDVGGAIIAVFDDTCGNLIQIAQEK